MERSDTSDGTVATAVSAAATGCSVSKDKVPSQQKTNVLGLSFKTRRHFVFCSTATSPRRRSSTAAVADPAVGSGFVPHEALAFNGSRLRLAQIRDKVVCPESGGSKIPSSSLSTMFLEDHDYTTPVKMGTRLGAGNGSVSVISLATRPNITGLVYGNVVSTSRISKSKMFDETAEDGGQGYVEMGGDNRQLEREVRGVAQASQSFIEDMDQCRPESGRWKTPDTNRIWNFETEVSSIDVPMDHSCMENSTDCSPIGPAGSTPVVVKTTPLRSPWNSSAGAGERRYAVNGRYNSSVIRYAAQSDCATPTSGVAPEAFLNKFQVIKAESRRSTVSSCPSSLFEDESMYLSERSASGSLDSTLTGIVIPSPFLIQTGLEKTLDFAEFHPMSPSTKEWEKGTGFSSDISLDVSTPANESVRTCDLSALERPEYSTRQNFFSFVHEAATNSRKHKTNLGTSERQTRRNGKVFDRRLHEDALADIDLSLTAVPQDSQVRRRKPYKRHLDFGSPGQAAKDLVIDLDRKKKRSPSTVEKAVSKTYFDEVNQMGILEGRKQKSRRPRKSKKLEDLRKNLGEQFDEMLEMSEKSDVRVGRKCRVKSSTSFCGALKGSPLKVKDKAVAFRAKDEINLKSLKQENRELFNSRNADGSSASINQTSNTISADLDLLQMILDGWCEYLMTPQEVMRQKAIEDAQHFGYNEDALEIISNGDLEVWRILDEMEPEFVRSGIEQYFS